jgi:hypothetical protein
MGQYNRRLSLVTCKTRSTAVSIHYFVSVPSTKQPTATGWRKVNAKATHISRLKRGIRKDNFNQFLTFMYCRYVSTTDTTNGQHLTGLNFRALKVREGDRRESVCGWESRDNTFK